MNFKKFSGLLTACTILMTSIPASYAQAAINVKDYGAAGDGVTDDTAAIQLAVNAAQEKNIGEVYFPKGTYITVEPIKLVSDIRIFGTSLSSIIKTTMTGDGQGIFEAENKQQIEIEGLGFSAAGDKIYAAAFVGCDDIQLADNFTDGCALSSFVPYAGEETVFCNDILVKNNSLNGSGTKTPAILLEDTNEGIVIGNIIKEYSIGIRLCNNTDEAIYNTVCSENVINDISETAIETENIERVTIGNNVIKNVKNGISAADIRYASLMGNVINKLSGKGMILKDGGIGININSNEIYNDIDDSVLFDIEKTTQGFEHKSVNITANTFHGLNGVRTRVKGGDAEMISVSGNHFYNATLDLTENASKSVLISDNQMIFEGLYDKEEIALKAGPAKNQLMIQNNQIRSTDFNSGSVGIYALQNDKETSVVTYIKGNSVSGMEVDIKTVANSESPIVKPVFLIKNNYFGNESYVREEGNTQSSVVRLEDNYTEGGLNFPSQIPTTGKWEKGQIIYFENDNQTGYIGAVCIAKGTPGIWKYFGKIEE